MCQTLCDLDCSPRLLENREWWEITIADGKMNWTALRQNEDGTTFTATFEMKKVE